MITTINTKALRVLLTLTALTAFPTNNNGMLVSAAPPSTRKLGKFPKATAPVSACPDGEKVVEVEINTDGCPDETSWAIYDACSPAGSSAIFDGDFTDAPDYYQYISQDLCLPEKGRYKFKILDSYADGIDNPDSELFDYSLRFDGDLLVKETDFKGSGFATYFGEGSCCEKGEKLVELKINTDSMPGETSWEITDACSGETVESGDFGDNIDDQEFYQSSNEVCVDEKGSFMFKISDSYADGILHPVSGDFPFEFDYSLRFDGDVVVQESDFNDGSDEVPFGKSSCKEPKASKAPKASKNKNTRHLRNHKQ